jgi:hypothetical protein
MMKEMIGSRGSVGWPFVGYFAQDFVMKIFHMI